MSDQNHMTVIGADTAIKGELTFDTTARILGKVEGKITSKGELQIGDTAVCKAALEAGKIVVDGAVEGNLTARDRVTLSSKARITGDIVANTLVVTEGASFTGHCRVGPEAGKSAAGDPRAVAAGQAVVRPSVTPARNGSTNGNGAAVNGNPDNLAAAFAGLEAKLAGINKPRAVEAGND